MKRPKQCKWCGDPEPNHWPYQCFNNPERFGKGYSQWQAVRKKWFIDNPADHYECYLCHKWLTPAETTLDHIIPRSNAKNYANRHDPSNLKPCCYTCNSEKGSKLLTQLT